jgi:hypothetical protein
MNMNEATPGMKPKMRDSSSSVAKRVALRVAFMQAATCSGRAAAPQGESGEGRVSRGALLGWMRWLKASVDKPVVAAGRRAGEAGAVRGHWARARRHLLSCASETACAAARASARARAAPLRAIAGGAAAAAGVACGPRRGRGGAGAGAGTGSNAAGRGRVPALCMSSLWSPLDTAMQGLPSASTPMLLATRLSGSASAAAAAGPAEG